MTHFIHHVPGRLRVKSPALKRNQRAAAAAKEYLDGVNGILSAEVSTVTGSIVVKYDAYLIDGQTILNSLHGMGHLLHQRPMPAIYPAVPATSGKSLTDTLVNKMLETVVERSAVALIAALI